MISIHKVIFPGMIAGCFFLVLVTNLIANPDAALAFSTENVSVVVAQAGASGGASDLIPEATPTPEEQPVAPPEVVESVPEPSETGSGESCSLPAYPDAVWQWCSLIETYASQHGLDPNLVAAVMLQESGGNPQAYSKSGAVGLMQVMPSDGLAASFMCINGPCFASRPSSAELFDPEFNIAYATQMLSGLIQRHGSVREALRSYGPMNMGYQYADIVLGIMSRYP